MLALGWGPQAFFLLGITVFLTCAVAFGFLYLVRELMLGRGLKACLLGAAVLTLPSTTLSWSVATLGDRTYVSLT